MAREYIPEELVVMILVKLPVKSLVRFRSLSKDYNALIRKTSFIAEHLSRSIVKANNKPNFLIFHQTNKFVISLVSEDEQSQPPAIDQNPPFIFMHAKNITVHAHFNGIIYLELLGVTRYPSPMILWNPSTREVKFLPFPTSMIPFPCTFFHVSHGFGVDPKTNDYKVVNVVVGVEIYSKREVLISQVYSLRSNSWKVVYVGVLASFISKSKFNAYLNGAYHWIAKSSECSEFVLCFDMSGDVFWKMNLPQVMSQEENKKLYYSTIVVLNDRVGYVKHYLHSEICFEIWVMNEYGVERSWMRMFNIARGIGPAVLLEFWKDDDDVVLGRGEHHSLVLHKIGEQQVVKEFPLRLGFNHRAVRYVESIVPLSGLVDEEA